MFLARLSYPAQAIRWSSEKEAMVPVSKAITLLKAAAAELNPYFARHHECAVAEPVAPATVSSPLTVAPTAMLASYADGGRYRIHSDNSCGEGGSRLNWRELTAIVYANPDWSEDDGGRHRAQQLELELDCGA